MTKSNIESAFELIMADLMMEKDGDGTYQGDVTMTIEMVHLLKQYADLGAAYRRWLVTPRKEQRAVISKCLLVITQSETRAPGTPISSGGVAADLEVDWQSRAALLGRSYGEEAERENARMGLGPTLCACGDYVRLGDKICGREACGGDGLGTVYDSRGNAIGGYGVKTPNDPYCDGPTVDGPASCKNKVTIKCMCEKCERSAGFHACDHHHDVAYARHRRIYPNHVPLFATIPKATRRTPEKKGAKCKGPDGTCRFHPKRLPWKAGDPRHCVDCGKDEKH